MRRTAPVALDQDFEATVGEVTKSWVDQETGRRFISGAASGLEQDEDGERVSKAAIREMINAINAGGIKVVAGTHEQNWVTEIGEARKAWEDPETEQLMVETELEPEGADPIADKAWQQTRTGKRNMSWSVGGKLQRAYYELTDEGKKRKVLDGIKLRHLCLTDQPAYPHGFATAVEKMAAPDDDAFVDEDTFKDTTTGSWVSGGGPESRSGQDSATGSQRNAGTKKGSKRPDVQDSQQENDDDMEETPVTDRHLSCPNCGHEFAADIPVDMTPEERQARDEKNEQLARERNGEEGDQQGKNPTLNNEDDKDEEDKGKPKSKGKPTEKSQEAEDMDLKQRIEAIEARLGKTAGGSEPDPDDAQFEADVAKTQQDLLEDFGKSNFDEMVDKLQGEHPDWDETRCRKVAAAIGRKKYGAHGMAEKAAAARKTSDGSDDVVKVVAVATQDLDERLEKSEAALAEGFEILGAEVMKVRETLQSLPTGRKTVSRVLPRAEGHEDGGEDDLDGTLDKIASGSRGGGEGQDEGGAILKMIKAKNRAELGIG